jgi:hypothetical protein
MPLELRDTGDCLSFSMVKPLITGSTRHENGWSAYEARFFTRDYAPRRCTLIEKVIDYRNAVEHSRDARGPLHVRDFSPRQDEANISVVEPLVAWTRATDRATSRSQVLQANLLTLFEDAGGMSLI